jgi:tetratricopeptide (TPR) repeat protein
MPIFFVSFAHRIVIQTAQVAVDGSEGAVVNAEKKEVLFIFLLAFCVRLVYLYESSGSPYFGAPFLDELYNVQWAQEIARGNIVGDRVFFRAPLYAYALGGIFALAGTDFFLPKLLQHLLGAIAVVMLFFLTRRVFGKTASRISALLAACYAPTIYFEGELLDISLQVFFYPAILLSLLRLEESPRAGRAIALGVLIGLSAVARTAILAFVPVMLIYLFLVLRKKETHAALAKHLAVVIMSAAVVILPVTLRNAVVGRCFVPIASYSAINFYIGNAPTADGYTAKTAIHYPFFDRYEDSVELFARREVEILLGKTPTAAEISRFWRHKAIASIQENPSGFVRLLWKKFVLFWNSYEIKNNKNIYFVANYSVILRVLFALLPFGLVAALGLTGMALAVQYRRSGAATLLILFVVIHMAGVIAFFVNARYRLPVVPLLLSFSGFAVAWGIREVREKKLSRLIPAAALFCAIFLLTKPDWYHVRERNFSRDHWSVGNCWKEKKRYDKAIEEYKEALALDPRFADAYNNLGEAYFAQGMLDAAEGSFSRAIRVEPDYASGYNNLGVVYETRGDMNKAIELYRKAIEIEPGHVLARKNLADAYRKTGQTQKATEEDNAILKTPR